MGLMYDVVILAGGRSPWLLKSAGTDIRCLAKINGKRILDYLVEALRESGRVNRIILAAPMCEAEDEELPPGVLLCEPDIDMPSTACKAVQILGAEGKVLYVCDDIPLLHAAAINDFLDKCEANPEAQAYYPVISKAACLENFPEAKRTYGKLADGVFTGGNMMVIDTEIVQAGRKKSQEIYARRKKPLELCKWMGFGFIIKFLLRRLTISDVEKRMTELMGFPCKCIISDYAEVGMDIDKPADLQLAEKYLG